MDQQITTKDNFSAPSESLWHQTTHLPAFRKLDQEIKTETAIIGGGITGITTAYMLAQKGVKVALIEAKRLASGTTGNTTAKISVQHGLIYDQLFAHFGKEKARNYYQANHDALRWIEQTIRGHSISCAYEKQKAILYATTDQERRAIEQEKAAYDQLGIPSELSETLDLPFQVKGGLLLENQAQFHPLMYLHFLISELVRMKVPIYEQTLALELEKEPDLAVVTSDGCRIHCHDLVIASHFPYYDANRFYFARMFPERSYLIACTAPSRAPEGMYLSAGDPKRSIRSYTDSGQNIILLGGENHKTGQGDDTTDHYQRLAGFANQLLGENRPFAHWSAQDFTTLDKVPYIGRITKNEAHVFVAAGFHKWGMTTSTFAAQLFTDEILGQGNPYSDLFSPSRFETDPMIKNFLIENVKVGTEFIKGKLDKGKDSLKLLEKGQGAIVSINGKRAGAYREDSGHLLLIDTTCTHLGCELNWNQAEKTWDCPCHGSRFSTSGAVIDGPALQPLKKLYEESKNTDNN
ncbi:MAG: FAD-dependent oxidoreductase [Sporolactobacillus sp.]